MTSDQDDSPINDALAARLDAAIAAFNFDATNICDGRGIAASLHDDGELIAGVQVRGAMPRSCAGRAARCLLH